MSTTRFGEGRRYTPRVGQSDVARFLARVISEEEQIPSITAQALDVAECWVT